MTIKMCTADKDPGPDGFTMAFFQEAWEIMKKEVIETMIHLHHNCHMVTYVNDSFIALIPKKKGAVELKDYRPISLISCVYKTASKLLAKRLKTCYLKQVSGSQNPLSKEGISLMQSSLLTRQWTGDSKEESQGCCSNWILTK